MEEKKETLRMLTFTFAINQSSLIYITHIVWFFKYVVNKFSDKGSAVIFPYSPYKGCCFQSTSEQYQISIDIVPITIDFIL